jgi:hypothetical protein
MTSEKGKSFSLEKLLRSELAVVFLEDRFVVEKVEVRGSTGHVEKDHAASLRRDFLKALWNSLPQFLFAEAIPKAREPTPAPVRERNDRRFSN